MIGGGAGLLAGNGIVVRSGTLNVSNYGQILGGGGLLGTGIVNQGGVIGHLVNGQGGGETALTYEGLLPDSFLIEVSRLPVRIVSLRRLIALKRAAGRPKDLETIAELEALESGQTD